MEAQPKQHIESWVRAMRQHDFLRFQDIVYAVATALAAALPTERMYSQPAGQRAPALAPRAATPAPYHHHQQQQFHDLMAENGVLPTDEEAQAALARDIRRHLRA
ncbi:hypothetical protein [Micromonospora sp. U21]|uniref:hypothetical protein n=1 Tax=Micromonospora sp. U21 TaxID=2824899 RepID=UPI001B38F2C0|nr:hypothetical protein [Micromonospora sp. U21]MBQ0900552.1 hypothetical protein [Micromonospora sp. U21]